MGYTIKFDSLLGSTDFREGIKAGIGAAQS